MEFITCVQTHLLPESESQILPFILDKVCWIVEHGLVENGTDAKFNEYATNLALDVIGSTIVDKILNLPEAKQSEKGLLISFYIRLLNSNDKFDALKEMAVNQKLVVEGKDLGALTKLQCYQALRKCAAAASTPEEASEIANLVDQETKRNFSDVDEIEFFKY